MIREKILLVGAGGHARSCIDVIEQDGRFVVAGLVGLPHEVGTQVLGYPVLGADADLPNLLRDNGSNGLITIGQIKTAEPRRHLFQLIEKNGFVMPTIISPRAYVSPHATIGAGTIVMHDAIVNAGAVVGRNCIINTRALVEHDAMIADHCHIATAAVINGAAQIGTGTFIGSGSIVRELIKVGERCVVGMGQRLTNDCADGIRMPLVRKLS